jgi:putative lipoprotein
MHTLKIVVVTLLFVALSPVPASALDDEFGAYVTVGGYVAYRQRITMPPEAVLSVRIDEIAQPDAPPVLVSEVRSPIGTRKTPIPFSMKIVSTSINPRSSYVLSGSITVNGELRLATTRSYPVLSPDAPSLINMLLDKAQPKTPQAITNMSAFEAKTPLFGTLWKLVELYGSDSKKFPNQKKDVTMTLTSDGSRFSGFGGCNSLSGSYSHQSASLRFTLTSTPDKTCDESIMDHERQVVKMLEVTTNYRIEVRQLTLIGGDDQIVARFDEIHP